MSYDDDEENASQDELSDDNEDAGEDIDDGADAEGDAEDADGDAEGDEEDGEGEGDGEGEEEEDQEEADSPLQSRTTIRIPGQSGTSPRADVNGVVDPSTKLDVRPTRRPSDSNIVLPYRPPLRQDAITASTYDIVPTIAAPHATSINAVTATPDMRWVFTGGSDGYIRKFNWVDSANSKLMLTVAQRHPFVDSVTKAGVLLSYWENEDESVRGTAAHQADEGASLSPVYSLAVQHQALWLLSGLESGGINLQTVRHNEGTRIATLSKHTSAVSVLHLSPDERSALSGSWDKTIVEWDLNTGQARRTFTGSTGQISCIEVRPESSMPVPPEIPEEPEMNGTFSSNNDQPMTNGLGLDLGIGEAGADHLDLPDMPDMNGDSLGNADDDHDSLFGDDDATFMNGDSEAPNMTMNGLGDEEEDEFSRAMANELTQNEDQTMTDLPMPDLGDGAVQALNDTSTDPNDVLFAPMDTDDPLFGSLDNPPTTNGINTSTDPTLPMADTDVNNINDLFSDMVPADLPTDPLSNALNIDLPDLSTATDHLGRPTGDQDIPTGPGTTFLSSSFDGTLKIWDSRQPNPVASIGLPKNTPPWCMSACWSPDGSFIFAGRRNNAVDEYSLAQGFKQPSRTFKFPNGSGAVSAVKAMPNGRNLVCASFDILRLYDLQHEQQPASRGHSIVPFLIIPGHRTGVISQLYIDPTCTFLISTAGNRGWEGVGTETLLGYEIGCGGVPR